MARTEKNTRNRGGKKSTRFLKIYYTFMAYYGGLQWLELFCLQNKWLIFDTMDLISYDR
eukprot:UN06242